MSRQKQLEAAAQLAGNAAAHIVLYKDPAGIREALEYLGQAQIRIEFVVNQHLRRVVSTSSQKSPILERSR